MLDNYYVMTSAFNCNSADSACFRVIVVDLPKTKSCPEHGSIKEELERKSDTTTLTNTVEQYVWVGIIYGKQFLQGMNNNYYYTFVIINIDWHDRFLIFMNFSTLSCIIL